MRVVSHPELREVGVADVLHALSDPVRLEVVRCLQRDGECVCGSLETTVAKSTLSHHLKILREAGVTRTRANGTQRLVSLRSAEIEERFPGLLESVLRCS